MNRKVHSDGELHLRLYLRALRTADTHLATALAFGKHTPAQRTLLQVDRRELNASIKTAVARVAAVERPAPVKHRGWRSTLTPSEAAAQRALVPQ